MTARRPGVDCGVLTYLNVNLLSISDISNYTLCTSNLSSCYGRKIGPNCADRVKIKIKVPPRVEAHRAALISVSVALSQTRDKSARPRTRG